jgi:hypothetical protein
VNEIHSSSIWNFYIALVIDSSSMVDFIRSLKVKDVIKAHGPTNTKNVHKCPNVVSISLYMIQDPIIKG